MKRRFSILVILFAAFLGSIPPAHAQSNNEQQVQEVFQTELVYPQQKGELQLTTGLTFRKNLRVRLVQVPVSLEYGITDRWQISAQWDGLNSIHPVLGRPLLRSGDLSIGTKYSFMNVANTNLHLAVGFELGLPSGKRDNPMSEGNVEYEPFLIAARDFPGMNNVQIFTQLGIRLAQSKRQPNALEDEDPAGRELNWNAGFFVPVRRLSITTEFNLVTNEGIDRKQRHYALTPGLVWRLPGSWEIGIGAPIGLTRKSSDSSVILKLTREF
jgi:hypothetical protein